MATDATETPGPATGTAGQASSAELVEGGDYVQDVDFRSGMVGAQMPQFLALVAALGGYVPPDPEQPFTYCDLGCGDGTTANTIAELYPQATVIGVDFNPGHIASARATAEACGLTNARFVEAPFSAMRAHAWPTLDMVAMNGTYAWLAAEEAEAVRRFLADCLRPGGLFYVEYTSLPGKISVAPLWGLIQYLVPSQAGEDSRERARKGLDLTEALAKRGMAYLNAHRPAANGAQSYIRGRKQDPYRVDHFAHNAMASGFRPRYFTEMVDEMAEARLTFAGRTELARNEIELCVPPAQVPTFQDYKDDPTTVELLKDYIRNEQQRRDVFVKDALWDRAAADAWLDARLRLSARIPAAQVQRQVPTLGNHRIPLRGPAYEAVIAEATQAAVAPQAIAEAQGQPLERVRKAALRLLATNQFVLCRAPIEAEAPDPQAVSGLAIRGGMNQRTLTLASQRLTQNHLLSPVTGGPAVPVSPIEAVLLQAVHETGDFAEAPAHAQSQLAEASQPLPVPGGRKPAQELTEAELREILDALRGQKITNLFRWHIAEPRPTVK